MSAAKHEHDGWPDLPKIPPPIERLGEHASVTELARSMGTTLVMFGQLWPRMVQAVEYLRRGQERIEAWMDRHDQVHQQAPTMRPQLGSNHDLARAVGADVAESFEAEARNPATPPPTGAMVAQLVEARVADELAKVRAAYAQRLENEQREAKAREAAELAERQKLQQANALERVKARWAIRVAIVAAVLEIADKLVSHFLR